MCGHPIHGLAGESGAWKGRPTMDRAGATGSLLPVPPTRRFQAVKIRDCRLYAAEGWHGDPTLPIIQSLPVAIP
jgi:hypothetical protein